MHITYVVLNYLLPISVWSIKYRNHYISWNFNLWKINEGQISNFNILRSCVFYIYKRSHLWSQLSNFDGIHMVTSPLSPVHSLMLTRESPVENISYNSNWNLIHTWCSKRVHCHVFYFVRTMINNLQINPFRKKSNKTIDKTHNKHILYVPEQSLIK